MFYAVYTCSDDGWFLSRGSESGFAGLAEAETSALADSATYREPFLVLQREEITPVISNNDTRQMRPISIFLRGIKYVPSTES